MTSSAHSGDRARLVHMIEAIQAARQFAGLDRREFDTSAMRQYATERAIQILGDAAKQVSDEVKEQWADVPWREVAGMRDVIVHH